MKLILPLFSFTVLFAACSSEPSKTASETTTLTTVSQDAGKIDTSGLAAFQQWRAQNELNVPAPPVETAETTAEQAPVRTVTIVKEVRIPAPAPARRPVERNQRPVPEQPTPVEETTPPVGQGGTGTTETTAGGDGTTESAGTQAETAKKEGMSNATKGAVIGSAGGAVIGAVLNKKNRGVGAVIGGVVGGAVGYGLGKKKDNKAQQ